MLGLYLSTHIIGHNSCKTLSILKKLTLKKLAKFFEKKKVKTQYKKSNIKTLAEAGTWTQDLSHSKQMCYIAPPSQPRAMLVVKLFNGFHAMGRHVNRQTRICRPHISNKFFLKNIFTCTDNYIWQFLIFALVFTA